MYSRHYTNTKELKFIKFKELGEVFKLLYLSCVYALHLHTMNENMPSTESTIVWKEYELFDTEINQSQYGLNQVPIEFPY